MKKSILLTAILSIATQPDSFAEVKINELMQSNIDCIMDDLNEFPDSWVELYNDGESDVNLSGYGISDKNNPDKAYRLPNLTLKAKSYIIIYCDKSSKGRHTDFRLDSGKGASVYLFKGSAIIDKVEGLKKQPAPNIAYGRINAGSDTWGYQETPTPGTTNCGKLCKDILEAPLFSESGRVGGNQSVVQVSLKLPDSAPSGAEIRYTTDGTEPTRTSRLYTAQFSIVRTTVLRVKVFADGYLSPRSTSHSYIFPDHRITIPIVSMITDRRYFYDSKLGIYHGSPQEPNPNYKQDWRRPVNVELFMGEGENSVINQLCETRVKGGASRDAALKSLVVYANKRFGEKRLKHEFFPDQAPGLDDWKSIELRNSGNDFDYTYFRDALIQRVMGTNADLDWQPWLPAAFYINGEYKGILNIRSRTNEDHIYTFYNGEEDIDLIENWWELKEGSWDNFNAFRDFYSKTGQSFDGFNALMDCGEFANLMIMNLFYDNKDFPGNNIVCWRPRAEGGRWRWIAKDTDFGLGLYNAPCDYKSLTWLHDNSFDPGHAWANKEEHTRLFRRLMETREFRDMFIDRCAVYMGDFLNSRGTLGCLNPMYDKIREEYPHHRKLFNQWWPNHSEEVGKMRTWVEKRAPFFYNHIAEFYSLGKPRDLTVDADRSDDVEIEINGIGLRHRDFNGKFFEGRELTISGKPSDTGLKISGWSVETTEGNTTHRATYDGDVLKLTMPSCTSLRIQSILTTSGISDITIDPDTSNINPSKPVTVFDLQGRCLGEFNSVSEASSSISKGIYIIRQGKNAAKWMIR